MTDNALVKVQSSALVRLNNKIAIFNNQLDAIKEKELRDWWDLLDELWQDILLINYSILSRIDFYVVKKQMQQMENPYFRYENYFDEPFENSNFEIDFELLKKITSLELIDCQNTGIETLEPLRKLENLQYLDCSHNPMSDLEPISKIEGLIKLDCNTTDVDTLKPIKDLVNLEVLWISDTSICDIRPLKKMSELRILICCDTKIKSLKMMKYFKNLEVLNIESLDINSKILLQLVENEKLRYMFSYFDEDDESLLQLAEEIPGLNYSDRVAFYYDEL